MREKDLQKRRIARRFYWRASYGGQDTYTRNLWRDRVTLFANNALTIYFPLPHTVLFIPLNFPFYSSPSLHPPFYSQITTYKHRH